MEKSTIEYRISAPRVRGSNPVECTSQLITNGKLDNDSSWSLLSISPRSNKCAVSIPTLGSGICYLRLSDEGIFNDNSSIILPCASIIS